MDGPYQHNFGQILRLCVIELASFEAVTALSSTSRGFAGFGVHDGGGLTLIQDGDLISYLFNLLSTNIPKIRVTSAKPSHGNFHGRDSQSIEYRDDFSDVLHKLKKKVWGFW
mgnify:CR=1 FL=1